MVNGIVGILKPRNLATRAVQLIDRFDKVALGASLGLRQLVGTDFSRRSQPSVCREFSIQPVLCDSYRVDLPPRATWTVEEFVVLRDAVFAERYGRIEARRADEQAFFASLPALLVDAVGNASS